MGLLAYSRIIEAFLIPGIDCQEWEMDIHSVMWYSADMADDDPVTLQEQYVSSLTRGLRDGPMHHSTDIIAAVAVSSVIGSLLFRAKYNVSPGDKEQLGQVWRVMVLERLSKRGHKSHECIDIADISLAHWMDDICQTCHGRKAPKIDNCPVLADITCPACNGSGRKRLNCPAELRGIVLDQIDALQSLERQAGSAAIKKLSGKL